jgi:hypothetical protein
MSKVSLKLGKKGARSCDGCTKCCDGWLVANIAGEEMYPGKPCKFVEQGVGCTIYDNRPEKLCEAFECSWKASNFVPEKFSPKNTGQILSHQTIDGIDYLLMSYAGTRIDAEFLSWFVTYVVGNQLNAAWEVDGEWHLLGTPMFVQAKSRQIPTINPMIEQFRQKDLEKEGKYWKRK